MQTLTILGAAAGAIVAIIGLGVWIIKIIKHAIKPIAELREEIKKSNRATCSTLRYSISRAHREYTKDKKIGRHALQSIIDMYERYKELGGNGFVDTLINELKTLPIDTETG